jgi:hypothetical protein
LQAFFENNGHKNSESIRKQPSRRLPIKIDERLQEKELPSDFTPFFIKVFGGNVIDKINQFGCKKLVIMHMYLQTPQAE